MLTCRVLDSQNPEDIRAFEKAQYQAFAHSSLGALEEIWLFDHTLKRVASRFSYHDLLITIVEKGNSLIGAMVIHTTMQKELQLTHFGFSIDTTQKGIAEGLSIFSLQPMIDHEVPLFVLRDFTNPLLRSLGFTLLYGTCSSSKLKGYLLLGFTLVDQHVMYGEEKFLLSIKIP